MPANLTDSIFPTTSPTDTSVSEDNQLLPN